MCNFGLENCFLLVNGIQSDRIVASSLCTLTFTIISTINFPCFGHENAIQGILCAKTYFFSFNTFFDNTPINDNGLSTKYIHKLFYWRI